jgi:hypothetical protein
MPLVSCFEYVACGLWIALPLTSVAGMAAERPEHLTTTDDLENREIGAAEIHRICPKWAYGGGAGRRAEEAF